MTKRSAILVLLVIVLVALGARLTYIYQIRDSPFFETPFGDPEYHDKWALQASRGDWVGDKVFFRAPLYPYLLGLTYRIFGHSYLIPRILQAVMGSLSCLLIYFVGKEVFDQRVGMLSAGIAALYAPFIYFEGELLITSLLVFLDLSLILLLLRAKTLWGWLGGGLLLCLSAIARPTVLVFLPFLLLFLWLRHRTMFIKYALTVAGGVVLLVAPVTVRNYLVGKDLVLIASQGGVNFYLGNNSEANGASAIFPGIGDDWDEVSYAVREQGRELKPSEVSRHYYLKGLRFLKERPGSFLRLLVKKVYLFLNGYEISNNQYIYQFGHYSPLLRSLLFRAGENRWFRFAFPFGLVSPLGMVGIWLSRRDPKSSLLKFFLFSYAASVIAFFVCSRYRTPLYPIFIIFSSFALFSFQTHVRQREVRLVLVALLAFLALFWFTNSDLYGESFLNPAQHHFNLGSAHLKRAEYALAVSEYQKTLKLNPLYPRSHLNLGVAYHRQGQVDKALQEYEKELEIRPEEARAFNNLAVIYRGEADYHKATEYGLRAIEVRPRYADAYLNLGITYEKLGNLKKAAKAYSKALEIDPSLPEGHNLLAVILLGEKQLARAISHSEKAVRLEPQNTTYRYNLGLVYARSSRYEEAIDQFKQALSIDPKLFPAYHNLAMVRLVTGDLEKASENVHKALSLNPDSPESKYLLELIRLKREESRRIRESK